MKKIFAFVLVLMMVAVSAMAEAPQLNWSDVESAAAGIDGEFHTFDQIALKFWVPAVLQEVELSQEDIDNGYIGYFKTEDETAAVGVQYVDVQGMTLEEYAEQLKTVDGVSEVTSVVVNGIEAVSYDMAEKDTTVVAYTTEAGYVIEFAFAPMSDEGFSGVIAMMIASIQPE